MTPKRSRPHRAPDASTDGGAAVPARKTVGRPFTGQHDPRNGRGLPKGTPGVGRPRDEWRAKLRAAADRDEVAAHVEATLLRGPDEKGDFWKALAYVTEHGYGKAPQSVDITSGGEKMQQVVALMPPVDPAA